MSNYRINRIAEEIISLHLSQDDGRGGEPLSDLLQRIWNVTTLKWVKLRTQG